MPRREQQYSPQKLTRLRQDAMLADGCYGVPNTRAEHTLNAAARQKQQRLQAVEQRRDEDLEAARTACAAARDAVAAGDPGARKALQAAQEDYEVRHDHWMRHLSLVHQELGISVAEQRALRGCRAAKALRGLRSPAALPQHDATAAARMQTRRSYGKQVWEARRKRSPKRPPSCPPPLDDPDDARNQELRRDTAVSLIAFADGTEVRPAVRPARASRAAAAARMRRAQTPQPAGSVEEESQQPEDLFEGGGSPEELVEQVNKQAMELLASQQYLRCYRLLSRAERMTCQEEDERYPTSGVRLELRATTFSNLACMHKRLGKHEEALSALEEAFAIEETLGKQSAATLINLAAVLLSHPSKGRRQDALIPASGAVAAMESELLGGAAGDGERASAAADAAQAGAGSPRAWHLYVIALHSLAMAKASRGDEEAAAASQRDLVDAYEVGRVTLGAGHQTVTTLYRALLQNRVAQGEAASEGASAVPRGSSRAGSRGSAAGAPR
eukprot:TRINITY_DN7056_c0_g1_i1.p1 TRINITY_DN7056_c0_g1~~TRINITY_DN7056_c0_g1_i1.p1  ORF type:complete len:501 (+),score=172.88 TRINITY_DN7056_c0_g1_i1:93-1595(+)